MAQQRQDLLSRLADRGEQVVGRITEIPGAKVLLDRTTQLAKNLDELQRRVRSLAPLEKRVTALERRLDKLEGKPASRARPAGTSRSASRRTSSAARPAAKKTGTTRRTTRRSPRRRGPETSS